VAQLMPQQYLSSKPLQPHLIQPRSIKTANEQNYLLGFSPKRGGCYQLAREQVSFGYQPSTAGADRFAPALDPQYRDPDGLERVRGCAQRVQDLEGGVSVRVCWPRAVQHLSWKLVWGCG
jgi:hypothetical protein